MANEEMILGLHCHQWGLLRQELADRLGDAGAALFNFALNSWLFWPNCSCLQALHGISSRHRRR